MKFACIDWDKDETWEDFCPQGRNQFDKVPDKINQRYNDSDQMQITI